MAFNLGQKLIDKIRGKKKIPNCIIKYSGVNNKLIIHKADGSIKKNPKYYKGLKIEFNGNNSVVEIYEPNKFKDCYFNVGNNNKITIRESIYGLIKFNIPYKMSDNSILDIGKDFHCVSCDCYMHDEKANNITIGDDVLFSFGIILWPSDGHTIYDVNTNKAINKSTSGISIGSHVWVCMHTNIMKNVKIPNNCTIGARSLVNKSFEEENIILAGVPAKIIKSGVNWAHCGVESWEGGF